MPITDDQPLTFQKHPRNSILGASLVLEALGLPKEKINEFSLYLANEFQDAIDKSNTEFKEELIERGERMKKLEIKLDEAFGSGCGHGNEEDAFHEGVEYGVVSGYNKAIDDLISSFK